MMKTKLLVLILILGLVSITSAQPGRDVTWTQADSALHPFCRAGSGVLGNYFYCFGGENACWAQAFNLTTEQWEVSTPPPVGLDNYAGVATNDAIYLIGRYAPYGSEVQKFTPISGGPSGTWTLMAPYPVATCGVAAAWDGGNFIYTAGGNGCYSLANRYDLANNHWTPIADLPAPRNYAGGAFVNGKFYVVGYSFLFADPVTLEYDPSTNAWTRKSSIPSDCGFQTFNTAFNDSLIFVVAGGGNFQLGSYWYPATDAVLVYNPLTDYWTQETPLPAVIGLNSARFIPPDKVISAGGMDSSVYYGYVNYSGVTYIGRGFPTGGLGLINITMTPINPPIIIPASGGSFSYNATLENQGTAPDSFDVWIMVQLPSGSWWGPALGPVSLTLPGSGSITRLRTQTVPASAPAGDYWYEARVGDYPNNVIGNSGFVFTKSATGDGPRVSDWSCTGEEIGDVGKSLITHNSSLITSVQPNPFNPSTVLSYQLPVAGNISLRVYDTAGRLVTELVNGWRDAGEHQITFDPKGAGGSGLPSGIYFAKLEAGEFSQVQKLILLK